jgi:hypothetical protein
MVPLYGVILLMEMELDNALPKRLWGMDEMKTRRSKSLKINSIGVRYNYENKRNGENVSG